MTVRLTSPVLGQDVGYAYTGPLESWLLNEGYATSAATLPNAWAKDSDGVVGAKVPTVTVTPTAAVVTGTTDAVNLTASGTLVLGTKGGVTTSVTLASADVPSAVVTKINAALTGLVVASLASNKLVLTSVATGEQAYVKVVSGNATILTNLGLAVNQQAYGGSGRPAGAANTGPQADVPANDPRRHPNREAPYWPSTPDRNATIANDGTNLTKVKNPAPNFDFDANDVDTESPSQVVLDPKVVLLAGGKVKAYGNNLEGVTAVTVGGTAVTNLDLTALGNGVVSFTAPAKTAGAQDVVFTDASGNTTLTGGLTYAATV